MTTFVISPIEADIDDRPEIARLAGTRRMSRSGDGDPVIRARRGALVRGSGDLTDALPPCGPIAQAIVDSVVAGAAATHANPPV